jgi:hypothetical protein
MLESPFFLQANHLKPRYVTLKIKKCKVFLDNVQPKSIVINIFGLTIVFTDPFSMIGFQLSVFSFQLYSRSEKIGLFEKPK